MTSFAGLVTRIKQMMYGFSQEQQQWTYLTSNIGSTDTGWNVADATQVSRGLVEIDGNELCLVKSVNRQTNIVTLNPFARGWAGTTAASHSSNAPIENNPIFPTVRVKEAINDAIRSMYPDLFAVGSTTITKLSVQFEYQLPAAAEEILSVQWQTIGPSHVWPYATQWRFSGQAATSDFASGKSLYIGDAIVPGRQIWVNYRQEPTVLVNDTDDFAGVSGLPDSAQDVVIYAACMKLAPALEGPRLILDTAESAERAAFVQPGSASRVSQAYAGLYAQRLEQEIRKLRDRFQIPSHFDF